MSTRKPITRSDIATATAAGKVLGANRDAASLLKILAAGGGFGPRATTLKGVATALYGSEATQTNRPVKAGARRMEDTRTRGDTRLANLARGGASFILDEALAIHAAFVAVFGMEWGRLISPEALVLKSPQETFRRVIAQGLPWPETLPSAAALATLRLSVGDDGLMVRPVDAKTLKLGGLKGSDNADLEAFDDRPRFRGGEDVLLQVKPLRPGAEKLFVFEVVEAPLKMPKQSESYALFPHIEVEADQRRMIVGPEPNAPFHIFQTPGEFTFMALAFPKAWEAAQKFQADPSQKRWSEAQARRFVEALRAVMLSNPGAVRIGQFAYRI